MRADPGDAAHQDYRHRGDRPDQHLEAAGILEIGQIAGALVGCAEPGGNAERGQDRRDHDRQHDAECVEQNLPFVGGNRSFRIEDAFGASTERYNTDQNDGRDQQACNFLHLVLHQRRIRK